VDWQLAGRVAVVTGAGRGLGRAITDAFLAAGAVVAAVDLDGPDLRALAEGPLADAARGEAFVCDVTSTPAVDATVAAIVARFGRIDVVVNNAGVMGEGLVDELDDATWQRCFDVNTTGVFRVCRAVLPVMKRQRSGRIVNAASFAAIVPSAGSAAYAASKAAVVQFTRTLAGEVGPWGITANSYAPGMVPSQINHFTELPAERQARLLDTLTIRRWGDPAEVADVVLFLASDAARYVTGTLVDVSGGKLATQLPERAYQLAEQARGVDSLAP